jgi:hypothetical protein
MRRTLWFHSVANDPFDSQALRIHFFCSSPQLLSVVEMSVPWGRPDGWSKGSKSNESDDRQWQGHAD